MIKIGNATLPTNVLLAPMSGCTDLSFRLISREHGAQFAFFEMIDSHSVFYHRRRTHSMLKTLDLDEPIALQLLGADPEIMLKAARDLLPALKISFLDINAACPARKVIKKRAGAYLLESGDVLYRTIDKLASSLNVPVTVKIRLGFGSEPSENITELASRCEAAGASAIFVHGRTRLQMYAGEIDYAKIKAIKEAVRVPVFGSGNILSAGDAAKMLSLTGCDGILVARGALGNPWIFSDIQAHLAGGAAAAPATVSSKLSVLKRHLSYIEKHEGCKEAVKAGLMRKVAIWYIKSFPTAKRMRENICSIHSYEKMLEFIDTITEG